MVALVCGTTTDLCIRAPCCAEDAFFAALLFIIRALYTSKMKPIVVKALVSLSLLFSTSADHCTDNDAELR
jgi:hypothetical protein